MPELTNFTGSGSEAGAEEGAVNRVGPLLALVRGQTAQRRERLAAVTQDLAKATGAVLSDRERAWMAESRRKLVLDAETALRLALAERLDNSDPAPRGLIAVLRDDERALAGPHLARIGVLDAPEIIEAVHFHALRQGLAAAPRGSGSEAVKALVASPHPGIAQATTAFLLAQSRGRDGFGNPAIEPAEMSTGFRKRLYRGLGAALAHALAPIVEGDPDDLADLIEDAAAGALKEPIGRDAAPNPAAALARLLDAAGLATDALAVGFLDGAQITLFEAVLAERAKLSLDRVRGLLYGPGGIGIAILAGALGFEDAALDALRRRFADFRLLEDHPIERDAARQVLRRLRRNAEFEGFLDRLGPAGPEHTDRRRGP